MEYKEGRQFDTGIPMLVDGGTIKRLVVFDADELDYK
jgi:hypothetical protein